MATTAAAADLVRVHPERYLTALDDFVASGGGYLDGDTHVGSASWEAASLAAGAGLELIRRLEAGEGEAGFCAVRPPGHHALPTRAMGFCLVNNVAVAAAALAERGERVAIVDYDAHHGNGTQDIFWADPRVFYVSMHEWPMYPGTGHLRDVGEGAGRGSTLNLPFPAGTSGDAYRRSLDELVLPTLAAWEPTWMLVSAGFDAHADDPKGELRWQEEDFAALTTAICDVARECDAAVVSCLEGGYNLAALGRSVRAHVDALMRAAG